MCNQHSSEISRRQWLGYAAWSLVLPTQEAHALPVNLRDVRTRFEGLPTNTVVLTLDACSGVLDAYLENFLSQERIDCSIFATGVFSSNNPQSIERFVARGWSVLNHGERHHAPILSPGRLWNVPCTGSIEGLQREVENGASQLASFRGHVPRVYRGATAMYDARTLEWLSAKNWIVGGYSVAADAGGRATRESSRNVAMEVRTGDVLLAHINHPERNNGVQVVELLKALNARGFSFLSWEQAQQTGVRVQTIHSTTADLE